MNRRIGGDCEPFDESERSATPRLQVDLLLNRSIALRNICMTGPDDHSTYSRVTDTRQIHAQKTKHEIGSKPGYTPAAGRHRRAVRAVIVHMDMTFVPSDKRGCMTPLSSNRSRLVIT